ncbi:rhodanese-like domain-containing protein [bacterium SCSIO 12741]|nr:rhodanese-like domain-containing protein [bacterium SCSIO 12741]
MSKIIALLLVLSAHVAWAQQVENREFNELLKNELRHDVPEIDVAALSSMQDYVLIDARSMEEYQVSHLEGARQIDFIHFDLNKLKDVPKDRTIVVYCSVGSRSEKVAKVLIDNGYTKTLNLYGGIFEWSNQGKPMVNESGEPTQAIHGVSKEWAKWISQGKVIL